MLNLAFLDELLHRAGDVFDRNVGIYAVLVEEIDGIDVEPLERGLGDLLDVLGAAVQAPRLVRFRINIEAKFRCDHDLPAEEVRALRLPAPHS